MAKLTAQAIQGNRAVGGHKNLRGQSLIELRRPYLDSSIQGHLIIDIQA